ncbi:MAG: LPS assembly lipoprotein LptE [Candidatus Brocadiia bacterium]
MMRVASLIVFVLSLSFAGCYRVSLSDLPSGTVYVKTFSNETFYREFDELLNTALAEVLSRRSRLRRVSDEQAADYVLSGGITSIVKRVLRTGESDTPLEYSFSCTLEYRLVRRGETKDASRRKIDRSHRDVPSLNETQASTLDQLAVYMAEELVRDMQNSW